MTKCHGFRPILTDYDMRHPTDFVLAGHNLYFKQTGEHHIQTLDPNGFKQSRTLFKTYQKIEHEAEQVSTKVQRHEHEADE